MVSSLHGRNLIAGERSAALESSIFGRNPETGVRLDPGFSEASPEEVDLAAAAATQAFFDGRMHDQEDRARLLEIIADEIESLGDVLVERVHAETGLPEGRVRGERGRTVGQLRMFAGVVREGSWVDARIDRALPERSPSPRPDLRRMLIPIGPVAVFGASNFPLAFSVAGGDTASALAAGCPVIVKAHPAHPGTSELTGEAISRAVAKAGFHPGTFSMLHGKNADLSLSLVRHPAIKAVGFTGSLRAGRSIFDAAAARPEPIPVYAEMGSVNPVFVLPGALRERYEEIADGLSQSVTLGGGQFCTNPGVVVGLEGDELEQLSALTGERIAATPVSTLLHEGIQSGYEAGIRGLVDSGVTMVARASAGNSTATPGAAAVFSVGAADFIKSGRLQDEVFGPSTLVVSCASRTELESVARRLEGNLTATIHGTPRDLEEFADLVRILENKVGRLIFNGFPTGVEVSAAMHHGGPYPATTDVRSTSVGTAAILRFSRPICYQDFPDNALPRELRNRNERGIWRMVDDELTRADI